MCGYSVQIWVPSCPCVGTVYRYGFLVASVWVQCTVMGSLLPVCGYSVQIWVPSCPCVGTVYKYGFKVANGCGYWREGFQVANMCGYESIVEILLYCRLPMFVGTVQCMVPKIPLCYCGYNTLYRFGIYVAMVLVQWVGV